MEIEEGRLLCGVHGGDTTDFGRKRRYPDDWTITAKVVRDTARTVLGVSSKQMKEYKVTWGWDEKLQESIRKKRLTKKK